MSKDHCACNGLPCDGVCQKEHGKKNGVNCIALYDKGSEDRKRHRETNKRADYKQERKSNE